MPPGGKDTPSAVPDGFYQKKFELHRRSTYLTPHVPAHAVGSESCCDANGLESSYADFAALRRKVSGCGVFASLILCYDESEGELAWLRLRRVRLS